MFKPRPFYWLIALLFAAPGAAGQTLSVELTNPPERDRVHLWLYRDADAFGGFRAPLQKRVFAPGEPITLTVEPGDYALLVFRDENGNGELDRNFIGIPREPIALSNNHRPKGPPSFERARLSLNKGEPQTQTLTLERPLGKLGQWGLGLGAVGQTSPYRGSNATPAQVIPALVYIGERLQWTGPRLRYTLLGQTDWRLALQADLRLGAYEESESDYLAGLGDRRTTLMLGLNLIRELPAGIDLSLSASGDLLDRSGGQRASLSFDRGFQWGNARLSPSVGLTWLSAELAGYEFGVPSDAATDWRPAYDPGSALNPELGLSVLYELTPGWQLVGRLTLESLDKSLRDSPLVEEQRLYKGFFSLTYAF